MLGSIAAIELLIGGGGGNTYAESIDLSFGEDSSNSSTAKFLNTIDLSSSQKDIMAGGARYLETVILSLSGKHLNSLALKMNESILLSLSQLESTLSQAKFVNQVEFSSSASEPSSETAKYVSNANLSQNMDLISWYLETYLYATLLDRTHTFSASGVLLPVLKPGNLPPLVAAPVKGNGSNSGLNTPPLPTYSLGSAKTLVLASDASGTAYSAGVPVALNYPSTLDILGEWNGSQFKTRMPGNYMVIFSVGMPSTGQPASATFQVSVNGNVKYDYPIYGVQAHGSLTGSTPLSLNAGDTVEILFNPVTAFTSTTDPTTNFLSIVRSL